MKNDFVVAINQVCAERGLSKEVVLKAVEDALISAYRKDFGSMRDVTVGLDSQTGEAHIFAEKTVVVEVQHEDSEIALADAQRILSDTQLGAQVKVDVTPKNFGRIATQAAKQAILQRIRGAERDALYVQYQDREGEIINGTVQSIDKNGTVHLSLGKVEAVLPKMEQLPGERYRVGQRVRAYVFDVQKEGSRGPQVSVSRARKEMLHRLLELEVPEIFNGTVEIKVIAREAGHRSKVAVSTTQEGVDPVGACVGMKGIRIQSVVNELNNEKIDVVAWNPSVETFVGSALSPARVLDVFLDQDHPEGNTAIVVVPDKQLSLAIGKEGQNARLAAKLTGWRIDIKSASEASKEAVRLSKERQQRKEAEAAQRLEEQKRLEEARALLKTAEEAEEKEELLAVVTEPQIPEPHGPAIEPVRITKPPAPEQEDIVEEPKLPVIEKTPPPKPVIPAWVRAAVEAKSQEQPKVDDLFPDDKKRKTRKPKRRKATWQEELEHWRDGNMLVEDDIDDTDNVGDVDDTKDDR